MAARRIPDPKVGGSNPSGVIPCFCLFAKKLDNLFTPNPHTPRAARENPPIAQRTGGEQTAEIPDWVETKNKK